MKIRPPRLRHGDGIGIIAPAGPIEPSDMQPGIDLLESSGFRVHLSPHLYERKEYLAGDDETRLRDFHDMFRNNRVKAILCARGGYGTQRLLENIDYELICGNPKIIAGYSDITALLIALYRRNGLITFHGPMVKDLGKNQTRNLESFLGLVTSEEKVTFSLSNGKIIRQGQSKGVLLGGNLSILCHMVGTRFMPSPRGKILLIEEKGEPLYRIDRMLTHLTLTGVLRGCAAVVFGQFSECGDEASVIELLEEKTSHLNIPVVTGLGMGHGEENVTLPIGVRAFLDTEKMNLSLMEPCVSS